MPLTSARNNDSMSAELSGYFATIRKVILGEFKAGNWNQSNHISNHVPSLVTTAMTLMRGLPIKAIETDKDGCFCVTPLPMFEQSKKRVLAGSEYQEVFTWTFNKEDVASRYARLAFDLHMFYKVKPLMRWLLVSLNDPDTKWFATLKLNAKTHKPIYKVRNIHACPSWKFASMAAFLAFILKRKLDELNWLIKDSL
eukprot:9514661-Karenia_brevis.AAC.1